MLQILLVAPTTYDMQRLRNSKLPVCVKEFFSSDDGYFDDLSAAIADVLLQRWSLAWIQKEKQPLNQIHALLLVFFSPAGNGSKSLELRSRRCPRGSAERLVSTVSARPLLLRGRRDSRGDTRKDFFDRGASCIVPLDGARARFDAIVSGSAE